MQFLHYLHEIFALPLAALFFGRLQGAIFRNAFYSKMLCKGLEKF